MPGNSQIADVTKGGSFCSVTNGLIMDVPRPIRKDWVPDMFPQKVFPSIGRLRYAGV